MCVCVKELRARDNVVCVCVGEELCVCGGCDNVVCERVACVCERLCVTKLCVCVTALSVKELRVKMLRVTKCVQDLWCSKQHACHTKAQKPCQCLQGVDAMN